MLFFFSSNYVFWAISRYTDSTRCQMLKKQAKIIEFLKVRAKSKTRQEIMKKKSVCVLEERVIKSKHETSLSK